MRTKKTEYKHILLWPDGTPTVSGTRLKLKFVAGLYRDGVHAEEIQRMYPMHTLAEIFSALAYYFDHRESIDDQMDEADQKADELWKEIQSRQGAFPTRAELEARLKTPSRVP